MKAISEDSNIVFSQDNRLLYHKDGISVELTLHGSESNPYWVFDVRFIVDAKDGSTHYVPGFNIMSLGKMDNEADRIWFAGRMCEFVLNVSGAAGKVHKTRISNAFTNLKLLLEGLK